MQTVQVSSCSQSMSRRQNDQLLSVISVCLPTSIWPVLINKIASTHYRDCCRHRDLDLVHDKDVARLCNNLKAAKYHFSDYELQEVQKSLANCQYRKGIEFNLRLKRTPEDPRPKQHTSVKHFVDDMCRR